MGMSAVRKHKLLYHRLSQFFQPTVWRHSTAGQVLSSQSIVSSRSGRAMHRGRWIGHWKTSWPTVSPFAPQSQTTEAAIPHLCKQEQKCPTLVRRRLSRTQAVTGAARNFVQGINHLMYVRLFLPFISEN